MKESPTKSAAGAAGAGAGAGTAGAGTGASAVGAGAGGGGASGKSLFDDENDDDVFAVGVSKVRRVAVWGCGVVWCGDGEGS